MNPARISIFAPLISAVCHELPPGYSRERILFALVEALWALDRNWNPSTDYAWCQYPPFLRVARLSDGYLARQAIELPKRVPWWIADKGKAAAKLWLDEYARGADERDVSYDDDHPLPEYFPIPGPHEARND